MGVNITEVARKANVSTATAARAFASPDLLSPRTRGRVLDVAKQLGYVPNRLARSLRKGKTQTIAVLTTDLQQRLNTLKLDRLQQEIMQRGYHTLLLQYGDEANLLAECRNLIDGLVLCCLEERPSLHVLRTFLNVGMPLVSLEPCSGLDVDVVTVDREFGSYLAVKHLRNLGHTQIALAQIALKSEVVSRRTMGYQCAMQDLGLELQVITHPGGGQSAFEDGYGLIRKALAQGMRPTAWIFSDDELAVGALRAFQERQIRVPDDVAIVGWDNSPLCDFVRPRLTSVTQPITETVSRLVERLLARLEGIGTPAEVTLIRPELIARESCGSQGA